MKKYKVEIDNKGMVSWFKFGTDKRHREDGPAIEYVNGTKFWYVNGKLHRKDGPAIEYADGDKVWYLKDKLHREDGPAIEYADGDKSWWVNGKKLTEEEFNNRSKHTLILDGKEVQISNESYKNLKEVFNDEEV